MKDLFEGDFVEEVCATIPEKRKLLLVLGVALECCILPQALYLREIYFVWGNNFGCIRIWVLWEYLYTILYSLNLLVKVFFVIAYRCRLKAESCKSLMHPLYVFVSIFLLSSHCFLLLFFFFPPFTYFRDLSKVHI